MAWSQTPGKLTRSGTTEREAFYVALFILAVQVVVLVGGFLGLQSFSLRLSSASLGHPSQHVLPMPLQTKNSSSETRRVFIMSKIFLGSRHLAQSHLKYQLRTA